MSLWQGLVAKWLTRGSAKPVFAGSIPAQPSNFNDPSIRMDLDRAAFQLARISIANHESNHESQLRIQENDHVAEQNFPTRRIPSSHFARSFAGPLCRRTRSSRGAAGALQSDPTH